MEINVPSTNGFPSGFWNSITRYNKPVKVIGSNGENYAVEADGHVYVVPKRNITLKEKVFETTAPKPDALYLVTLTSKYWHDLTSDLGVRLNWSPDAWGDALSELSAQLHKCIYTNEWFTLSSTAATAVLTNYRYNSLKHEKDINGYMPIGLHYRAVVQQLWEEKNRRDGIVPA